MALNADLFSLCDFDAHQLSNYATIILGTPVYGGKALSEMDLFCRDNLEILLTKRLGLFAVGLSKTSHKQQQLESIYLKPMIKHACKAIFVGGAINTADLSKAERFITRTMLKIDKDTTEIDQPAIEQLIASVSQTDG